MAKARTKKKKSTRRRRRSSSLSGLGTFNASRISTTSVLDVAKPLGIGFIGAAAGHFAGKGKNLILAGAGAALAIATGYGKEAIPAVIGCAVVTPPTAQATAGIDGLDGLKDFVAGGANRGKGYLKSVLSNAGLQTLADKVPISGLGGLGTYDEGYMDGIGDMAALDEGDDMTVSGLSGYITAPETGTATRSIMATIAANMGAASN